MLWARARTASTEPPVEACSIIGSPPWWWRSMSWRNVTSRSRPVAARRRARSAWLAMPGICAVGIPIQPMYCPDGGVSGWFHRVSQPSMRPIWEVWVVSMSKAS